MAYYAALTTLLNLVEDILLHDQYPNFHLGKHPVVECLYKNLACLEDSLEDYSSRGDKNNDRVEEMIKDVAHCAQDIIEFQLLDHVSEQSKPSISVDEPEIENACVEKLQIVNQTIVAVLVEVKKIKEMHVTEGSKPDWDSSDTSTAKPAPVSRNILVGLDEYLITIKDQLCGHPYQLRVISIVGTGGIGKTTLARYVYDDALVVHRFDHRAWVVASQDFNMNKFLKTIVISLGAKANELVGNDEGELKERIYKRLKGRRYLVVIDDMWSTKVWDDVKQIFPNDNSGSRIILTTRLLDAAEYATTSNFLHKMQFLNDDQSWNLLQQLVFVHETCPLELEDTGKLIARLCCGLPLAVAIIAGVLSTTKTPYEWKEIASRAREILSDMDEHLSEILSLSYNNLPHQLKACFLYMGCFPEDHEINVSNLIKLWVAEGFLKLTDRTKLLEEVAEDCLTGLVKRNLLLITKKRSNGQPTFCILHDLLRDFCRKRALHESFFHVKHDDRSLCPKANEQVCHINWYYSGVRRSHHKEEIGKLVRSIHLFGENSSGVFTFFECADIKLVRVFNESGRRGSKHDPIPNVLFQHFNLRYLAFGPSSCIPRFPNTFSLQNLQSLIIQFHDFFKEIQLPHQIWRMTHLRHLVVPDMFLPPIPQSIADKLECLQTLVTVINFTVTNEAIEMIPNLRKLKMSFSAYGDYGWESYSLNNLFNLTSLEELAMRIFGYFNNHIPSDFAFPLSLKKLSLRRCRLSWRYLTLVGSLPHLQVLRLERESFVREEWEPKENEFLSLKFLLLKELNFKYRRADETHFPCMEHLEIKRCENMEMIPLEIGKISILRVIKVFDYGHMIGESAIRIRDEQRNLGNDGLQV